MTTHAYNLAGGLVQTGLPSGTDARSVQTCYGSLAGGTCDGTGYDALNRVTAKSYSDNAGCASGVGTPCVSYAYSGSTDFLSAVSSAVSSYRYSNYDALGRPGAGAQTTGTTTWTFPSVVWTPGGQVASITYPSGRTVATSFDGAGRVKGVSGLLNGASTQYMSSAVYAAHGGMATWSTGDGLSRSVGYNARLQTASVGAGTLLSLGFGYNAANNGNVASQTITWPAFRAVQSYGYDGANRLVSAAEVNGSATVWSQTYVYDNVGNRAVMGSVVNSAYTPAAASSASVPFNGANQWVGAGTPASYDAAGNTIAVRTQTMGYDAESRMVTWADSATGLSVAAGYDGDGRRVTKGTNLAGSSGTTCVYDPAGSLAVEVGGVVPAVAGTVWLTADHLGSTRLVTNAGGLCVVSGAHDYLPFGEEIPGSWGRGGVACYPGADGQADTDVKFTGQARDAESGLDYFGARYMSGAMGRFISPDYTAPGSDPFPVPGADFDNPQSLNLYAYVRNNPLSNVDPDGHDCIVQTRTSDTSETVSVSAGDCKKVSVGDGQTKTYIAGVVDTSSIQSNGDGGITFGFTPYSGGGGVADLKAAPVPDYPGIAPGWGNNAQGYQQIAAAGRFINNAAAVYAGVYGSVFAAAAGAEIAAATTATRSGIIFRLAHGLRFAPGHSAVIGSEAAIKNAIAAAISSGAIQKLGGSAFQGVVNVGGAFIRFTGAFTSSGVVVSNVMGDALRR